MTTKATMNAVHGYSVCDLEWKLSLRRKGFIRLMDIPERELSVSTLANLSKFPSYSKKGEYWNI